MMLWTMDSRSLRNRILLLKRKMVTAGTKRSDWDRIKKMKKRLEKTDDVSLSVADAHIKVTGNTEI